MSKPRITGDRCLRKVEPPPITPSEEIERRHHGAWEAWLATLTPDEKLALEEKGLTAPELPKKRRRPQLDDVDEEHVSLGTCDDLPSEKPTPDAALIAKEEESQLGGWERRELLLLNHVLPTISDSPDPRLQASVVALALVDVAACQSITLDQVAQIHGVPLWQIQRDVRALQVKLDVCRADLKLLRYVMAPVLRSRRPGLEAETIAKAARIGLSNAASMEDVGQKHGVCRAAISRRVRVWCKKLNLPLPRECKRNTELYQFSNITRQPKFDPSEDGALDADEN